MAEILPALLRSVHLIRLTAVAPLAVDSLVSQFRRKFKWNAQYFKKMTRHAARGRRCWRSLRLRHERLVKALLVAGAPEFLQDGGVPQIQHWYAPR
ncbi:MAG: hypothetical protein ACJ8D0_01365 [Xanthobacteraceae bacterium]